MLRNLELTILKKDEFFTGESISKEFSSIVYYYLLKLNRSQIKFCTYLKIWVTANSHETDLVYESFENILFVKFSYDFSFYNKLSIQEKKTFQCGFINGILNKVFQRFNLSTANLDLVANDLIKSDYEMQIIWLRKSIGTFKFKLKVAFELNYFDFIAVIINGSEENNVLVFKSEPNKFVMDIFKAYKIEDNKIRFGNAVKAFFEINLEEKSSKILVDKEDKVLVNFIPHF